MTRERNLARLRAWVEGMRERAQAEPDPDAFLLGWHDWLGRRMSDLGADECPRHLAGLTAFDLGEAQIALRRPLAAAASA